MAKISKIFYVVTQSEFGGAQRYIFDLAMNLPTEEFVTTVLAGGDGKLLSKFNNSKVATKHLKHMVREISPLKDLLAYLELRRIFKKEKPDIVHLNSSKAGVIGAFAASSAGVPKIIYTVHGFVFNEPMSELKRKIYLAAEKISAKKKTKIICVSNFDKNTGIKNNIAPENKFTTVHNGLEEISFLSQEEAREKLSLPVGKKIIGTIANYYPTKGLEYLIDAAKKVTDKNNNICFSVMGSGALKEDLEKRIEESNIKDKFILLGQVDDGEKYLKAFDYYVCSSVKEGLPYSVIAAMQAGLGIVSTNVGGIPELINEQTGILVEPKNPAELATGIEKLINSESNELGENAKAYADDFFSLEKMVARTIREYQN